MLTMAFRTLLLTLACVSPVLAQPAAPSKELVAAFDDARRGTAGPHRLDATEALVRLPHESNLERFLKALESDGRAVVATEKRILKLEKLRRRFDQELAKQEKRGTSEQVFKARDELDQCNGDLQFRRQSLHTIARENRLLRTGWKASLETLAGPDQDKHLKTLLGKARSARDYPLKRSLMKLLAVLPRDETSALLAEVLHRSRDPHIRAAAADALGDQNRIDNEPALCRAVSDDFAIVRSAAIMSLRLVGGTQAVEALIQAVGREEGRLLQDAIVVLRHLTGVTFHDNVALWEDWWRNSKRNYKRPGRFGKKIGRKISKKDLQIDAGKGNEFYGLRFRSHALVYLIDISGSMNEKVNAVATTGFGGEEETKLDRAKRELIRSLQGLPSGMKINIIAYSNGLRPYHPRMVKLDDITRRGIIAWVKTLRAHGKTNIYDAVEMVLLEARGRRGRPSKAMIVDTVMLLTDGQPTAGKVQASDLICSEVARLNEQTRIVIHTVGIGPDHDARLLKRLSAESQGVYVRAR